MESTTSLAEIDGGSISYEPSLFSLVKRSLDDHTTNPAIIVAYQEPEHMSDFIRDMEPNLAPEDASCLTWNYAEIHHAALKVVSCLGQQGVQSGATIVTLIPNGIEWAIFWWSSILGKYALCSIDLGALDRPRTAELQDLLTRVQPDAIVVPGLEGMKGVDAALSLGQHKASISKICLAGVANSADWLPFHSIAAQKLGSAIVARITSEALDDDLNRTKLICFTSGTTSGRPKGCPRSVKNEMHTALAQKWGRHNDATSRNLLQTQNFRIIAPAISLSTWMNGGCVVMPSPSFSPSHILRAIETYHISMFVLIPAMVHALTAHPAFSTTNLSSLKTMLVAGDMITHGLYSKISAAFPECKIIPSHGMTEGGSAFASNAFTDSGSEGVQQIPFYADISPIGKVNKGTCIRVADEQNMAVKRGEVGELHFSSGSFVTHYLDTEKLEDFYTDAHGRSWFKSGDTGMINNEGWVYMLGRKKDIIKRAGVPITPAALESCIDTFLDSSCSVLGVEDKMFGQVPFAVVQELVSPRTKEEVGKRVIEMFGKDYELGGVATLSELGLTEWPLNATGKIVKRELERPVMGFLQGGVKKEF